MKSFWNGLGQTAKIGFMLGVGAIVLGLAVMAWWIFRSDYQVLFADLKPQDTAAMTAELDKLKIPYRLDEASSSIFVDKAQVHPTRIKLMGKELPLHGAVGFELFNNTDFGMTEFAQKINYQRALQGELTRTIISLSEIKDVRVHLALAEQGLFKQATARPKAAVTLTLREGQALRAEQVSGIQRLVAAATPGMTPADVTVVDKDGIALSRASDDVADGPSSASGTARLDLKRDTEAQLARKASLVLDKAFGSGQALASVDVTLNMDQIRTTTEDVIPSPAKSGESRGVIVKEKESVRDGVTPSSDASRSAGGIGTSNQREVDYQVGRRVEQVFSQAGAIRRIQVVAIVRQSLDAAQEEKLRRLLAAAVGASLDRGDSVVVQSMQALKPAILDQAASPLVNREESLPSVTREPDTRGTDEPAGFLLAKYGKALAALALGVLLVGGVVLGARRSPAQDTRTGGVMTAEERQVALRKVQAWMNGAEAPTPQKVFPVRSET